MEIDLTRYGIPIGTEVDLVEIAGDGMTNPAGWSEADPAMAAVLHAPCACDDGIECTWDCDPSGACVSEPHDAGTPCSTGVCDGAPVPSCVECVDDAQCGGDRPRCDRGAHVCVECAEHAECDDSDQCTRDFCAAGACAHTSVPAGTPCSAGLCDGAPEPACVECLEDGDCDDRVECTLERCVDGLCARSSSPRGTACDDGMCDGEEIPHCVRCTDDADCGELAPFCTVDGRCVECREHTQCDDDNECTRDACDEGACTYDAIVAGAPCRAGTCNGDAREPACVECSGDEQCDDGRACTTDSCDLGTGACVHTPACTDGGLIPSPDAGTVPPPTGCACRVTTSSRPAGAGTLEAGLVFLLLVLGRTSSRSRRASRAS
ncbi:MAG: hypothetical protein M5U28_03190 [Sandaracinaceae bacterium]|nr:hypothetical protein [Sandaracinaceae bacterium]